MTSSTDLGTDAVAEAREGLREYTGYLLVDAVRKPPPNASGGRVLACEELGWLGAEALLEQAVRADERRAVLAECVCGHVESAHDSYGCRNDLGGCNSPSLSAHHFESREVRLQFFPMVSDLADQQTDRAIEAEARVERLEAALRDIDSMAKFHSSGDALDITVRARAALAPDGGD